MSSVPSKIFKWYSKSTFFAFSLFYLYFFICISFFHNFDEDRFSMVRIKIYKMWMWQGLEKTCIGIYFSDQIWVIKTEYLGWSTLKSNYYQTLIDFEFLFLFTWFNTLYTTTFMFTNLDLIHTRICYGILNENNRQEYSILLVAVYVMDSYYF
jgi:hypothetical protein